MSDTGVAVTKLYRDAGGRLAAYGYVLTGSQHDAEDLVQAAVVKVFVGKRRLEAGPRAEAYVRAAMRTLHIDQIRRDRRWDRLVPKVAEVAGAAERNVEDEDAVAQALATLSPRVRTAAALRYYDDLTVADVAHAMGVAEGTVKQYLAEARAKLAPIFGVPTQEPERVDVHTGGRK